MFDGTVVSPRGTTRLIDQSPRPRHAVDLGQVRLAFQGGPGLVGELVAGFGVGAAAILGAEPMDGDRQVDLGVRGRRPLIGLGLADGRVACMFDWAMTDESRRRGPRLDEPLG